MLGKQPQLQTSAADLTFRDPDTQSIFDLKQATRYTINYSKVSVIFRKQSYRQ